MDSSSRFLDPATLSKLKGLELKARMIVEGSVSGMHKSPFHGFSVEFAEHREYVPGDDLRYVDWKVFGKSDRVYLKQYEEETNFACHLLVDTSESMIYQSEKAPYSKREYAQYLAAALAYLIIHQQDAVGLATFDSAVNQLIRPGSTAAHHDRGRARADSIAALAARGRARAGSIAAHASRCRDRSSNCQ